MHTGLWLGRLQEDYMEDRYKWENSFRMDIKWDGKPWIGSSGKGHGQVMACCAHGSEYFGSIKCEESIISGTLCFSGRTLLYSVSVVP